jgi:hypothetical protein
VYYIVVAKRCVTYFPTKKQWYHTPLLFCTPKTQKGNIEMNITEFVDMMGANKNFHYNKEELFELVKRDDKLLMAMCDAVMKTYADVERIKKIIG